MPNLNIRRRRRAIDLKARKIRRDRLSSDAKHVVSLVKATRIARRQGVVLLVFDLAEGDIAGYMNVDPIMAALALVSYLEQTWPRRSQNDVRRSARTHRSRNK